MDVSALQKEFRDKTLIVQHLVLLKKATSASSSSLGTSDDSSPTGYVLEELVGLTYTSEAFSAQLADFMCSRISAPSRKSASRLKTLRATRHVSRRGARAFRRRLRDLDESLRAAAANADVKAKAAGATTATEGGTGTTEQEIRNVAKEIREYIFSEEVMRSDASDEPEVSPKDSVTMTGMGSTGKTTGGKYEGFGSSVQAKETIGSRVADLLERAISPTDDKAEALRICMTSSTGDYQPVKVPVVDMAASIKKNSFQTSVLVEREPTVKVKRHVPGRAGGGWESSDSEEERDEQLRRIEELSVRARADEDNNDNESAPESKEDPELRAVREFLDKPGAYSSGDVKAMFHSISDANSLPALHLISESLGPQPENESRSLRAMLLLEHFLRSDRVRVEVVDKCLGQALADLALNNDDGSNVVKTKARKIRQTVLALLQASAS